MKEKLDLLKQGLLHLNLRFDLIAFRLLVLERFLISYLQFNPHSNARIDLLQHLRDLRGSAHGAHLKRRPNPFDPQFLASRDRALCLSLSCGLAHLG